MLDAVRHYGFSARLDCHYLVRAPQAIDGRTALVLTLHGFGQDAETMLPLTEKLVGRQHVDREPGGSKPVFSAGQGRRGRIRLGGEPARAELDPATPRHGAARSERSGPGVRDSAGAPRAGGLLPIGVAELPFRRHMARQRPWRHRTLRRHSERLGNGRVSPGESRRPAHRAARGRVLSAVNYGTLPEKLRLRVEDVEFHLLDGGHRFPSKGNAIAEGWLARILR